jgi:hypothetical protein
MRVGLPVLFALLVCSADCRAGTEDILASTTTPCRYVGVVQRNLDGSVLVRVQTKPRFRVSSLGCTMLRDEGGRTFSNIYTLLVLDVQGKSCATVWSSLTFRPAVQLPLDREYRFLLRLSPKDEGRCDVLKIWDGDVLLVDWSAGD